MRSHMSLFGKENRRTSYASLRSAAESLQKTAAIDKKVADAPRAVHFMEGTTDCTSCALSDLERHLAQRQAALRDAEDADSERFRWDTMSGQSAQQTLSRPPGRKHPPSRKHPRARLHHASKARATRRVIGDTGHANAIASTKVAPERRSTSLRPSVLTCGLPIGHTSGGLSKEGNWRGIPRRPRRRRRL